MLAYRGAVVRAQFGGLALWFAEFYLIVRGARCVEHRAIETGTASLPPLPLALNHDQRWSGSPDLLSLVTRESCTVRISSWRAVRLCDLKEISKRDLTRDRVHLMKYGDGGGEKNRSDRPKKTQVRA